MGVGAEGGVWGLSTANTAVHVDRSRMSRPRNLLGGIQVEGSESDPDVVGTAGPGGHSQSLQTSRLRRRSRSREWVAGLHQDGPGDHLVQPRCFVQR